MAQIALNYSAAQINAAIAKINSLVSVIEGSIVQLYDGSTAIYPRTKAEAVFFDNDTSKTLDTELTTVKSDIVSVQKEAVYDVSAHNSGAVFESLQALLSSSSLGTLIPTSVRCGGMSIRFIQGSVPSSDNKYVQYRCMSDEFTTDVTKWQGVDDVPTAGSDNLAKSGGTYKTFDWYYKNVIDTKKLSINRYSGFNFDFISNENVAVKIKAKPSSQALLYSVYRIQEETTVDTIVHNCNKEEYSFVLEKNSSVRIYNEVESSDSVEFTVEYSNLVKPNENFYQKSHNYSVKSYDLPSDKIISGKALNPDGSVSDAAECKVTDFLPLFSPFAIIVRSNFCVYDAKKQFIGIYGIWSPTDSTEKEYILPHNAAYLRAQLSNYAGDFSSVYKFTLKSINTSSHTNEGIDIACDLFNGAIEPNPIIASPNQTETEFLEIPAYAKEVIITGYTRILNTHIYDKNKNEIAVVSDNGSEWLVSNVTIIKKDDYPNMKYIKRLVSTGTSNDRDTLRILSCYNVDYSAINNNIQELNNTKSQMVVEPPFVYPEDFEGGSMSAKIAAAVDFIKESQGGFTLVFGKNATAQNPTTYLIDEAILLYSNMTIKIVNSKIQMADNVIDNMFRTANIEIDSENPLGFAKNRYGAKLLHNIRIIGDNAELIMENNTSHSSVYQVGWRGMVSCFYGVDGFEVSNIKVSKNLAWALAFNDCQYGTIHDIEFDTNRGNGDGVDLISCNNVSVYNISGRTEDDTIAISTISSQRLVVRPAENTMPVRPMDYDLHPYGAESHHIYVENIYTSGVNVSGACVDIVEDDIRIHDIFISNIKSGANKPCAFLLWAGYGSTVYSGNTSKIYVNNIEENENNTYGAIWLRGDAPRNSRLNNVSYKTVAITNQSGISDLNSVGCVITNTHQD